MQPSIMEKYVTHGGIPIHVADIENVYRLADISMRRISVSPSF